MSSAPAPPGGLSPAEIARILEQSRTELFEGELRKGELFWAAYQPFLLSRGYKLRPRYDPDWVPTWKKLGKPIERLYDYEDSITIEKGHVLDAVRVSDGRKVILKRVLTSTEEIPIARYLSSEPLSSDPRNNAVPILDTILLPNDDSSALIVMPLLLPLYAIPFRRVGEFAEAVRQYLQGLEFMHEHNIAHRDPCEFNLMMDASELIPSGFHFLRQRTYDGINEWDEWRERGSCESLRYYFIDFGLSRRYSSNTNVKDVGIWGQDRSYPERSSTVPYDPFKTDIYMLGNFILRQVAEHDGLECFRKIELLSLIGVQINTHAGYSSSAEFYSDPADPACSQLFPVFAVISLLS
ncbi:putative expressed protein [Lyophyllum shimeji]|uniref:Expressed protein n=1 Tax=Lyophyllum shimeji TaxID=47721 RepID=A0A9P3PUV7_LYOSH|nr:putative expressed protein [Lyophyllum shimeji]